MKLISDETKNNRQLETTHCIIQIKICR